MADYIPMTLRQYEEQSAMLNDPEYVGSLTVDELLAIRDERNKYAAYRDERYQRLSGQGLSDEQIAQLDDTERGVAVDPRAEEIQTGDLLDEANVRGAINQGPFRDVAGMVEGGKQAIEGVFDVAMDISYGLGLDDEASRAAWKQGVSKRRLAARQEHLRRFGRLPGEGYELIGNIVPWLASSTGQAARLTHYLARNAFLGGVSAASQFQPEEKELGDRWLDVAFGTTLGAGMGSLFGVPGALKRRGANHLVRAFNDLDATQREGVETLVREMTGNPEFKFSAAQLTGSRFYTNLEVGAADKLTKEQQNKNLNILLNNIFDIAKAQSARGRSAGAIAKDLRGTLKKARTSIYNQATSLWGANSRAIVESYGDDAIIRGRDYLQKVDDIIEQETNALTAMGGKPSANLLRYRERVDEIVNPVQVVEEGDKVYIVDRTNPEMKRRILGPTRYAAMAKARRAAFNANESRGPSTEQTLEILNGLNRLIGGDAAVFENVTAGSNRNIGRALMGAFTSEMEGAATNPEAMRAINLLRQGYRADMAAAQAIDESVTAAVFGGRKFPKQPGKALDTLMRQEPAELRATRQFLEEWNPSLLEDVQRTAIKRAALRSGAQPGAAHVDGAVDLNKLANNLSDGFKREGMFGSGLFDPATQADLKTTAEALRVLANKQFKGIVPGGPRVEEFTINLISRSPEFAGRFITRLFASGRGLEDALLNPEWRHALRKIASKDLNSDSGRAALLYLTNWWAGREEERKHFEAQQARMAEAKAQAEANLLQGGPQ